MKQEPLPQIDGTLRSFFEKFQLFAELPNAVSALREIVLQIAIRGALTERRDDESCDKQLRIVDSFVARRRRRVAGAKSEIPFSVPESWAWVGVGDVMEMVNGKAFKPEHWSSDGKPIIRIQNLNNETAPFNHCSFEVERRYHVADGDLLISWSGTPGTSFGAFIWNRGPAYLNQHIFRCELIEGVFVKDFLRFAINARLDEMISHAQGAVGLRHITKGKLESIQLPLPPLAEQRRIVAKVDELMGLCDRLEEQQRERETRHAGLARASLARFTAAPTPANLDYLFHKSYSISPAELRKAILTLAVQGKLVEQDPDDESVKQLLERNDSSRETTAKSDRRADAATQPLLLGEERWPIPQSWKWRGLADAVLFVDYRGGTPKKSKEGVRLITAKNVRKGVINTAPAEFLSETVYQEWMVRGFPSKGDVLFTTEAPMGNAALVDFDDRFALAQRVICFKSYGALDSAFLVLQLLTDQFQAFLERAGTGVTAKGIKAAKLKQLPIAIPPLAEQRRIVAKVDQLMSLVDQLETQLAASQATAKNLLDAVVAELTAA